MAMIPRMTGYMLFVGVCFVALVIILGVWTVHGAQAADAKKQQAITWYLMVPVYNCDPCKNREDHLVMPSIDVCRQIRDLNSGTRCITQDDEKSQNR
jgi:hypothetical protein